VSVLWQSLAVARDVSKTDTSFSQTISASKVQFLPGMHFAWMLELPASGKFPPL
jgi:hypothetical protein